MRNATIEDVKRVLATVIHFSSNDTVYVKESMEQILEWLTQVA